MKFKNHIYYIIDEFTNELATDSKYIYIYIYYDFQIINKINQKIEEIKNYMVHKLF